MIKLGIWKKKKTSFFSGAVFYFIRGALVFSNFSSLFYKFPKGGLGIEKHIGRYIFAW